MPTQKSKIYLAGFALVLFLLILVGLFGLATSSEQTVGLTLSFAAGLSMIFLPCTLPLVFVIVPLTMGQKPKKGLIMSLLFGLGISITLAFYGLVTASLGAYFGLDKVSRIMFTIAGLAALVFGLQELKLLKFSLPSFSGASPKWIQKRKDYSRTFFMGLFLGNAGIGCPNPGFYVLLTYIASVGSLSAGAWLGFIHGIGRATPLIFLAILGILGVNSLNWVTVKKTTIIKIMGWGLIVVGSFILTYGVFGMPWWEDSIFHSSWNSLIYNLAPQLSEAPDHSVAKGFFVGPFWAGWTLFLGLIITLLFLAAVKKIIPYIKAFLISGLLLLLVISAGFGLIKANQEQGTDDIHKEEQFQANFSTSLDPLLAKDYDELIFVEDSRNDEVIVLSREGEVIKRIKVDHGPHDIAASPDNSLVATANFRANSISLINVQSLSLEKNLPVGDGAHGLVFSPDGQFLFVANARENTLSVIETETFLERVKIDVDGYPEYVGITKDGSKVFTTNLGSGGSITVIANKGLESEALATLYVGIDPHGWAVSPDGTKILITSLGSNFAHLLDGQTMEEITHFNTGAASEFATFLNDNEVWVTNIGAHYVSVIDIEQNKITHQIAVGETPHGISFSLDKTLAFVPLYQSGEVVIIDVEQREIIKRIKIGGELHNLVRVRLEK